MSKEEHVRKLKQAVKLLEEMNFTLDTSGVINITSNSGDIIVNMMDGHGVNIFILNYDATKLKRAGWSPD